MGLRKLTQWEETVAKQEQKQSRLMSVAIVCVIAMCAVLWLVQDKLYGDVVRTGAAAYGCSFIGVAIGLFVRSTTGETWATSSELQAAILDTSCLDAFLISIFRIGIFIVFLLPSNQKIVRQLIEFPVPRRHQINAKGFQLGYYSVYFLLFKLLRRFGISIPIPCHNHIAETMPVNDIVVNHCPSG